jgi:hypothetical protein
MPDGKARDEAERRAVAELGRQLPVPHWRGPGWQTKTVYTVTTLCEGYIDFGRLDGLIYHQGGTIVTVTSVPILKRWLIDHKNWWGSHDVPASMPAAFRSDAFYTQALATDAAANIYGIAEVKAPVGAVIAFVQVAAFAQDFVMDGGPDTLLAVVVRGDRVFIAREKLAVATKPVPLCQKRMKRVLARAKATPDVESRDLKDGPDGVADRDYRACFAQHLREQKTYDALQKQAQALVDILH